MDQKIDFVLLWVDGNDPDWREEKNKYSVKKTSDNGSNRYREWDNLRYWFRGVEKFAPWVNKIHFVTCGHLPKWLNRTHPKLNIVAHKDYINEKYLPTFNSRAIEVNLQRIEGLSEKFVYFNDDTFVIRDIKPTDFFKNGVPRAACGFELLNIKYDKVFYDGMVNNLRIINRNFDAKEFIKHNFFKIFNLRYDIKHIKSLLLLPWSLGFIPGFINPHLPNAYLKSVFEEVWEREPEILEVTSGHKFRDSADVNQYIFQYWQFMTGKFFPINSKRQGQFYYLGKEFAQCCKAIQKQKYKIICINDDLQNLTEKEFLYYQQGINGSFEKILYEKSRFEV
ncbi:Stealth CR1 domain-containing protein [Mordavella massiliensis]|uniref:Stealth CR1 domain-containing protein n=1 Tax=Mordavella massiliensis TaxID=1871024 RepID=UPI002109A973|nr:Stealth CR1 domain-containing protein [Mordavella massiliensis]